MSTLCCTGSNSASRFPIFRITSLVETDSSSFALNLAGLIPTTYVENFEYSQLEIFFDVMRRKSWKQANTSRAYTHDFSKGLD